MIVCWYRCLPVLIQCVMAGLFVPALAVAQTTIGGGLGAFAKNDGRSDGPYLGPGYGGAGPSFLVFCLNDSRQRLTAGAEVVFPGTISGSQRQRISGGENHFVSTHRDVLMLGVVALQSGHADRMRVAGVLGGGLARRHTSRVGTTRPVNPTRPETPFAEVLTEFVPALGGGPNFVFAVSDSVGIIALGRAHFLIDGDERDDGVVKRGVSSLVLSFTVGMQVTF